MASKLSYEELRDVLRSKLAEGLAKEQWVDLRATYTDSVVYRIYGPGDTAKINRRTYSFDKDGKLTLGNPEQVIEQRVYTIAQFKKQKNGKYLYSGKIFEAGDYPDKGIAVSESDLDAMVESFRPVEINFEHLGDESHELEGVDLGRLSRIWREGNSLFGESLVPGWLPKTFKAKELPVSVEISRDAKSLVGLAFVGDPRVADAALKASFSSGAGSRKGDSMSIFAKLAAFFSSASEEDIEKLDSAIGGGKPTPFTAGDGRVRELEAQLEAERKRTAGIESQRLVESAAVFAKTLLGEGKITPAEVESVQAAFSAAVKSDAGDKAMFSESGALVEGDNAKALKALFASRPTISMSTEKVPAGLNVIGGGAGAAEKDSVVNMHKNAYDNINGVSQKGGA